MSESFSTGRSHPERLLRLVTTVSVLLSSCSASVSAQITNPIARRWAAARVQTEEIAFLERSRQIMAEQAKVQTAAVNVELTAIRTPSECLAPNRAGRHHAADQQPLSG